MNEDDLDPPRVYYSFKPTQHERLTDKDKETNPEPIEVKKILRDNLLAESVKLPPKLGPRPWRSRRRRDYILLITIPNVLFVAGVFLLPKSPLGSIFGLSLMVVYSLGLTWIFWGVMDRD